MPVQVHEKILQCNIKCAYVCVCVCVCVCMCKSQKRSYSVASYVRACASAREDPFTRFGDAGAIAYSGMRDGFLAWHTRDCIQGIPNSHASRMESA